MIADTPRMVSRSICCCCCGGSTGADAGRPGRPPDSAAWAVPASAVSGVYFANLVREDTGGMSRLPFIVRDDAGNPTGLILHQGGQDLPARKVS